MIVNLNTYAHTPALQGQQDPVVLVWYTCGTQLRYADPIGTEGLVKTQ